MDSNGEKKRLIGPAELSMLSGLAFGAILVALTFVFDLRGRMVGVLEWIDSFGPWAVAVFFAVDTLCVPFMMPTLPLTMGAGFIFGVGPGTLLCLAGRTLGASIAFLVARHLFSARISNFILRHEKLQIADTALAQEGGRIVFLTRLVPLFPGKLSNYFFGLTRCSLKGFCLGSLFGMIPLTLSNTYMGSLAGDLATLGARDQPRTPLQWALQGFGLLAALAAAIALAHLARTRLGRYTTNGPKG